MVTMVPKVSAVGENLVIEGADGGGGGGGGGGEGTSLLPQLIITIVQVVIMVTARIFFMVSFKVLSGSFFSYRLTALQDSG